MKFLSTICLIITLILSLTSCSGNDVVQETKVDNEIIDTEVLDISDDYSVSFINEEVKDLLVNGNRIISPEEALEIINNEKCIILDVRTVEEFEEEHIKEAILLPLDEIDSKAQEILPDMDAKILVYCRSGRRSLIATEQLVEKGYTDVWDFGGILDWNYEKAP
ncbi:MAG: rhodanese-like domain-containing protein [Eubacteriales bacterium]